MLKEQRYALFEEKSSDFIEFEQPPNPFSTFSPKIKKALRLYEEYAKPIQFSEMERHLYKAKGFNHEKKGDELKKKLKKTLYLNNSIRAEYRYNNKVSIILIFVNKREYRPTGQSRDGDIDYAFSGNYQLKFRIENPKFKKDEDYYIAKALSFVGNCYRDIISCDDNVIEENDKTGGLTC